MKRKLTTFLGITLLFITTISQLSYADMIAKDYGYSDIFLRKLSRYVDIIPETFFIAFFISILLNFLFIIILIVIAVKSKKKKKAQANSNVNDEIKELSNADAKVSYNNATNTETLDDKNNNTSNN